MKKILTVSLLLAISVALYAQKEVTRFLGIPVDGSKTEMIQKLKAKGFRYNSTLDCLEGEFNGSQVYLQVATNNNKVWRIVVIDAIESDEINIRIKFNELCRQFQKNKKYMAISSEDYFLPEDENISYGIMVSKKQYEAGYYQLFANSDDVTLGYSNRLVWFKISETGYDKYRIVMYYDNEYNHADGEDL